MAANFEADLAAIDRIRAVPTILEVSAARPAWVSLPSRV